MDFRITQKIAIIFKNNASPINHKDNYKWSKLKTKFKWDNKDKKNFVNCLKTSQNETN